ncbi:UPF0739 protein C1orf74 homolog [Trichomycterus rosablanca]|uniref:UPF0739 protein C1orf74 homolog n=1 Tax=Trichomycterus rosablanca TaxID=2290929 RepID=UPI002F35AAE3
MAVSPGLFTSAALKFLCCGRKKKQIPLSSCLDLAVQIMAVDLGLKPALLYDINSACAEQIQQYVSSLQEAGLLTEALQIFSIRGSTLIVNSSLMKAHLDEVLEKKSLLTADVCLWREQPSLINMDSKTEHMVKAMLEVFRNNNAQDSVVRVVKEEVYDQWNLCTLFGILLGYPVVYWFDQEKSFENCLSMIPLVVNKVLVSWSIHSEKHCSCLYSYSVPEVLWSEVYTYINQWQECLTDRLSNRTVLTELRFVKETVILPSVAM